MRSTTPSSLTDAVRSFCGRVVKDSNPVFIPVNPAPEAKAGEYHLNVPAHVERNGGQPRCGWVVWIAEPRWIEAEFHLVWESPKGELVDMTPKVDGEKTVLFIPDPVRKYENRVVPNVRAPLQPGDRIVGGYLHALWEIDQIMAEFTRPREPIKLPVRVRERLGVLYGESQWCLRLIEKTNRLTTRSSWERIKEQMRKKQAARQPR